MRKKAIVFDMDGVIIDSQPLYHEFDIRLLGRFGHPATLETVIPYSGLTSVDRMTKYKKDFGLRDSVDDLIKMSVDSMRDVFLTSHIEPVGGIPELLLSIKNAGLFLGVASSTSRELIELILRRLDVWSYFDRIVSGEEVEAGKPAPDVYLKAAEVFGVSPAECAAIEDSVIGMRSAKAAGFTCIAYRNSYTRDYSHADFIVDDFYECIPLVEKLCAS